jgi:hypothetical protein
MFVSQWSAHKDKAVCIAAGKHVSSAMYLFSLAFDSLFFDTSAWSTALRDWWHGWLRQVLE